MARTFDIDSKKEVVDSFRDQLRRGVQSCHLSFLLGSGASCPAIPTAGPIEVELAKLDGEGKKAEADKKLVDLLRTFDKPTSQLLSGKMDEDVKGTLENYVAFLKALDGLLEARRSTLLPKQTTVFSINYDLFMEKASEECTTIILNDGFDRSPVLSGAFQFRTERFFDSTHHSGHAYGYTSEVPTINLLKMHGSLTWKKDAASILYGLFDFTALPAADNSGAHESFLSAVNVVVPGATKFRQTTLERTYYDLLRIFSNQMESRNSILFTFGFSFVDDHLVDILTRALRNPTLQLFACCYSEKDVAFVTEKFANFNNVTALFGKKAPLDFKRLNRLLASLAPTQASP